MDNRSDTQDRVNANIGIFAMVTVVILSAVFLYFLINSPAPLVISANNGSVASSVDITPVS